MRQVDRDKKKGRKEMIDIERLLRQKKWDAQKLGQLIIASGINEVKFNENKHINAVIEKIGKEYLKLDSEEKEAYREYATVYTLLYIIQKDFRIGELECSHGIGKLFQIGFEAEAYIFHENIGKELNVFLERKDGKVIGLKKTELKESIESYVDLAQIGIKRIFAVNAILEIMAIVYSPDIKKMLIDWSEHAKDIVKYNNILAEWKAKNQQILGEPIADLFPEISRKKTGLSKKCISEIGKEAIATSFTKNNSQALYMRLYEWIEALVTNKVLSAK